MKATISLLLSGLVSMANAQALGIDFGDEFTKMHIVKPGTGFQIVENIQSGRKTATMVSYFEKLRVFGDDANAHTSKAPEKVFAFPKAFLFHPTDKPASIGFPGFDDYFPYKTVEDERRKVWKYQIDPKQEAFSGEELVAQQIAFFRHLAELANDKRPVRDAVFAIPADMNQRQRQALKDAAQLAGVTIQSLVTESAAAAIKRAIDWRHPVASTTTPAAGTNSTEVVPDVFTEKTLYINVGSRFTEACVVEMISTPQVKKNPLTVRVLACHAAAGVGGYIGDLLIADEMARRFKAKHKKDITTMPNYHKLLKKLLREAKKAKHVLSVNKNSHYYIEGFTSEIDFKEEMTKDDFDKLIEGPLVSRILEPIVATLRIAKLTLKDIDLVEIVGGGWRSPAVYTKLQEFLKSESELSGRLEPLELGQHMNGEESMSHGSAFIAANFSSQFRIKQISFVDTINYEIAVQVRNTLTGEKTKLVVVPKHDGISKGIRTVSLPVTELPKHPKKDTTGDDNESVKEDEKENDEAEEKAGENVIYYEVDLLEDDVVLETFKISPASLSSSKKLENMEKFEQGEIVLGISVDALGLVTLDNAQFSAKVASTTTEEATTAGATAVEGEVSGEATEGQEGGESSSTEKKAAQEIKSVKVRFTVEHVGYSEPSPMSKKDKEHAAKRLEDLDTSDKLIHDASTARNELESYVYKMKEKLQSGNESIDAVTTEEIRENLVQELNTAEEWLYNEGFTLGAKEFLEKVSEQASEAKTAISGILDRANELELRPKGKNLVVNFRKRAETQLAAMPEWISAESKKDIVTAIEELEVWFEKVSAEQSTTDLTQPPVYTHKDVTLKVQKIIKSVDKMKATPKPKKPTPTKEEAAAAAAAKKAAAGGKQEGDSDKKKTQEEKGGEQQSKEEKQEKTEKQVDGEEEEQKTEESGSGSQEEEEEQKEKKEQEEESRDEL